MGYTGPAVFPGGLPRQHSDLPAQIEVRAGIVQEGVRALDVQHDCHAERPGRRGLTAISPRELP
jgi:hypothetical protein